MHTTESGASAKNVLGTAYAFTGANGGVVGIAAVVVVFVIMDVNAVSVAIVVDLKFAATDANGIIVKTVGVRRFVHTNASVVSVETVVEITYVCMVVSVVNAKNAEAQSSAHTVESVTNVRSVVAPVFVPMDGGDPTVETAVGRRFVTMVDDEMLVRNAYLTLMQKTSANIHSREIFKGYFNRNN